jgi:hypothetical protein
VEHSLQNTARVNNERNKEVQTMDTLRKEVIEASETGRRALSEMEAIRRAQDGDQVMFEYLYRMHSRRVYAICLRMVKDVTEAEDLTQEAFLLLLRKIHTFRGESAFSTWLHRLAVNLDRSDSRSER